jgi:hypothetical protein
MMRKFGIALAVAGALTLAPAHADNNVAVGTHTDSSGYKVFCVKDFGCLARVVAGTVNPYIPPGYVIPAMTTGFPTLAGDNTFTGKNLFQGNFLYFSSNVSTLPSLGTPAGNNGGAFGWNKSGGQGEVDAYNLFTSGPAVSFSWRQLLSPTTEQNLADLTTLGFKPHVPVQPDTPIAVPYGGTGCSASSGTCLDNVSGFGATGIMQRTGPGTYAFSTLSALLDTFGPAQGSVLYRGASGWTVLPPGTNGQVLATGGGGANPSWVAPVIPAAGSRVLLNTITASNNATLADTTSLTATYSEYEVDYESLVPSSTGAATNCQLTLQVGGAFPATGYADNYFLSYSSTTSGSSTTYIPCSDTTTTISGTAGVSGSFKMSAPATSHIQMVRGAMYEAANNTTFYQGIFGGMYTTAAVVTGLQFKFGSGNIASGTIKIYGSN